MTAAGQGSPVRRRPRDGRRATGGAGEGRNATLVAAGIALSRVAGLVREVVTGAVLGVGATADAFKAALRIPNLLQNLLGEGVLSASFVPVYSRLRHGTDTSPADPTEAGKLAGATAGLLLALTAVLAAVGALLAAPLSAVLTPGFEGETRELTVTLLRIMFPGVGFLVLSSWCLGVLNSHRRFFLSYVAPVLWNAAQVAAVVAVAIGGSTERTLAEALAWGVLAGGVLQFAVQVPTVRRLVPDLRLSLDRRRRSVQQVIARSGPVLFGRGVLQVAGYLDLVLAGLLARGGLSADQFAQTLYLLPISLFGMSVAAAALPEMSLVDRAGRRAVRERLDRDLARVAFFVAPTAVAFVAVGETIVAAVFQRGEFGADDSRLVWLILAAYSLGLLATTASRVMQNTLYALDDTRTPARIALVRVVVGVAVALVVMFPLDTLVLDGTGIRSQAGVGDPTAFLHLGAVGIGLAGAVSAWVEFLLLRQALAWRIGRPSLGGGALAPALVAALAGAATARLVLLVGDLPALLAAPVALAPAAAAYVVVAEALGHPVASDVLRRVRR